MGHKSVAIDGPSGAGKSTLARQAAEVLGFLYVDTGAIYRTLGLMALERGVDLSDPAAVEALLPQADIRLAHDSGDGLQHMYLCGRDVTGDIRRPEVSKAASAVSAIQAVRENLAHCGFADKAKVAQMDAQSFLKSTTTRFDLVFLDPPYQQQIIDAVLPAVVQQMAPGGIILCETERNEQLPEQAGDYALTKTYFYGKAKITAYRRQEEA